MLKLEEMVGLKNCFAFADDLLRACRSSQETIRVFRTIKEWSKFNKVVMNERKSAILPLALRKCKKDDFSRSLNNIPYVKEYQYLGIVFDYTLRFDSSLNKAIKLVKTMENCSLLNQNNLSINQKLTIWKSYIGSKMMYPLLVLSIMNKSAAQKISSQISMAIKKCLGLRKGLPKERMYAWLYELTPEEKAELFLLRTIKKLSNSNLKPKNSDFLLSKLSKCTNEEVTNYLEGTTALNTIKNRLLDQRATSEGIKN